VIDNQTRFPWYFAHTNGNISGGKIGRWEDSDGIEHIGGCAFTVFKLPQTITYNSQQVNYRVILATITVSTSENYNGFTYEAGILDPGSLIVHDNTNQYNDSESLANQGAIINGCSTSASYGTNITLQTTDAVPGGLLAVGVRGDDSQLLSYPNSANGRFNLVLTVEPIIPVAISVINSFSGGYVKAAVDNSNPPSIPAGSVSGCMTTKTLYIAPDLEGNKTASYNYVFRKWQVYNSSGSYVKDESSSSASIVLTSQMDGYSYEAQMKKQYDINVFMTSGSGNIPGNLNVNGTSMAMPNSIYLFEDTGTSVTASVINASFSIGAGTWFNYTFDHWLVDDVSTSSSTSLTVNNITAHKNIDAYYKAKPTNGYKNMSYSGNTGDYITLNWGPHPNGNVNLSPNLEHK
jgi:hypothetical protein